MIAIELKHDFGQWRILPSCPHRMLLAGLYALAPNVLNARQIVKPAMQCRPHDNERGSSNLVRLAPALRARRELLWVGATAHPTAEWTAQQFMEALGWRDAPRYLVRDRDSICAAQFIDRVRAMGIRDRPASARSPWQNGYAERLIGTIRRERLDHVVVCSEHHLRTLLGCCPDILK